MNKEFSLPLVVLSLFLVPLAIRANDIEPGKEKYNAIPRTQTITIDGNMSDWDTTKFWKDTKFYIPKGSGSNSTTATNLVSFEPYGSGTAGQDHQSVSFGIVWDADNLYIGLVVVDDYHENAAKSGWNGDSLQMAFTDATRSTITQLYNIALGGTDDAPGSIGDIPVTDVNEQYSGCGLTVSNDWFVVRDAANKKTYYELKVPACSLGCLKYQAGLKIGVGLCVNEGALAAPGQSGWGGWGAHSIVFGKTASEAGLVTLRAAATFIDETSVTPADKAQAVLETTGIGAVLTEYGLGVKDGSEVLKLNGQTVNATVTPTGSAGSRVITISYQPSSALALATTYPVELDYQDANGNSYAETWSFTTAPPPVLLAAGGTLQSVRVTFSKPLDAASAGTADYYKIDNGVMVNSATVQNVDNNQAGVATLAVSGAVLGKLYTLTVNNVKDNLGHSVATNSQAFFFLYTKTIGVNFQGRKNSGVATTPLGLAETAGVVPQSAWNSVDDNAVMNSGTTDPLVDGVGTTTVVTLTYAANDSWNNDTDPTTIKSGNAHMMNGIIKANGGNGTAETFALNTMPLGAYDVYVYMNENGDGTQLNLDDGATTFFVTETHQFTDASTFIQATNRVDPATAGGRRDVGNYVKFTGESGDITITATHIANSDGCGIAGLQIVYPSGPTLYPPAPSATITITQQPQSLTVTEGRSAKLTVAATTTSQYAPSYQWKTNGIPIPGATSSSYTLPLQTLADSGTRYTVDVIALGATTQTSSPATVTVVPDTSPPVVLGATAFPGSKKVGVMFDKALDAASARNATNYQVNGAAVTSAVVRTNVANELTNEKNLVQLTVATALTTDFTLTLSGVKDFKGNAMGSTTVSGKILNLTSTDIGSPAGQPGGPDPLFPSTVTTWGPGAFDVLCNGNDYWNNADGFNFVWAPKTNSFDVKVRVVSVSPIDNWSAGAIEVREGPVTTNGGGWELARHYFCKVDYGGPDASLHAGATGANAYEFNCRLAPGDPTVRETGNGAPGGSVGNWGVGTGPGNPGPPSYPNAWIRIARVKDASTDLLRGYSSTDGITWNLRREVCLNDLNHAGFLDLNGNPAGKWPDVCYVGLGSTSHTGVGNQPQNNAGTTGEFWYSPIGQPFGCYVIYRDYGDVVTTVAPTLAFQVAANGTITLTYTGTLVSSDTVNGTYQPVTGATNPFTVNPKTTGKAATFYKAKQ